MIASWHTYAMTRDQQYRHHRPHVVLMVVMFYDRTLIASMIVTGRGWMRSY